MQLIDLDLEKPLHLPYVVGRPSCGFPSPAADFAEDRLDLHELLVKRPAATFILRVTGTSMRRAGIHPGDLIVCDRSVKPQPGHIIVASLDGDLVVKRLDLTEAGQVLLLSDPDPDDLADHPPVLVRDGAALDIWGRVMSVIHFT